ncbi:MAG: hypothetical protein LBV40_06990 [Methanomicrobiales archaeon]|nr:hypothetical protein [Methanomicrobiales archaeon]
MKASQWGVSLGVFFLLMSFLVYGAKTIVLGSESIPDTVRYLFNALGFLFISVFMTTLFLNQLLTLRDKNERKEKMNIIRSTFFSEIGTPFLRAVSRTDPCQQQIFEIFTSNKPWHEIYAECTALIDAKTVLDISCLDLDALMRYLHGKRDFLLRLLENPVFLEQSHFTELLRALFHLTDELDSRPSLCELPKSDITHLTGDIVRAYDQMRRLWLLHMDYLNQSHPYLFSLALRTNPFNPDADPIVRD